MTDLCWKRDTCLIEGNHTWNLCLHGIVELREMIGGVAYLDKHGFTGRNYSNSRNKPFTIGGREMG